MLFATRRELPLPPKDPLQQTSDAMSSRQRRRVPSVLVLTILLAAGLAGNAYPVPLFFGVDFLFGSIATLLVVCLYGPVWGVLATLIAGSYTLVLWNHPYALVIFTAETLFVGVLWRRRSKNLLLLDGLFWGVIGIPLVWLFYAQVMQMDSTATLLIMLKQSVNGFCNALLAHLLLTLLPWRSDPLSRPTFPLYHLSFILLAAGVFLPVLVLTFLDSRRAIQTIEADIQKEFARAATSIDTYLTAWYQQHYAGVAALAQVATRLPMQPSPALQHATALIKQAFPGFHNLYIADATATTIAFFPAVNAKGESTIGLNFADREYFHRLQATRKPVLSDVFLGRGGIFVPIVTLSVPVLKAGRFQGFALGALDLGHLTTLLRQQATINHLQITLLDRQRRVIASTEPEQQVMQPLRWPQSGKARFLQPMFYQWLPADEALPEMVRWKRAYYVNEHVVEAPLFWTVLLKAPVAPYRHALYRIYIRNLLLALGFAGLALLLAGIVSRQGSKTLAKLATVTTDLPTKIFDTHLLKWPRSSIQEIQTLIQNFQVMLSTLRESFEALHERTQQLAENNAALQVEIDRRQHTEVLLARERNMLRTLIDTIPDYVFIKDREGRYLLNNGPHLRLLGVTQPDEALGKTALDFFPPDQAAHFQEKEQATLQSGQPLLYQEELVEDRAGNRRWGSVSRVPLRDAQGHLIGLVGIGRDITEQKTCEAQLRQAQKLEALGILAGGIAHDFNNILAAILGYTELALLALPSTSEVRPYLQEVLTAGNRAKDLAQQILLFSRQREQERTPLQLHLVIKEALKLLRASLPTTIEIRQVLETTGDTILADPTQMHQVLMNLCTNASQAMQETGGVLEVWLEALDITKDFAQNHPPLQPGPHVCLTVRDTGPGIPPEHLDRIFEPFFTTKAVGEGTGLGLAVVHGIVTSHGGTITVESTVGQGTTFRCYLPRQPQTTPSVPSSVAVLDEASQPRVRQPQTTPSVPSSQIPVPRGSERILWVDDEAPLAQWGYKTLSSLGYEVVVCTSSIEALEVFWAQPYRFDLVITDQTMPQMTGEALARALRQVRPNIPIILCTGFSQAMTKEKARQQGIDAFLLKPFGIRDLGMTVRRVLEQTRSRTVPH